LISVIIF